MRLFTVLRCKLADGYKSGVFCSRGCSFLERGLHGSPRFQDSQDGRRTVWERYGNRFAPKPEFTTTCAQCAVQFRSTLARRKFCSSDCANARQRALNPRAVQSTRECCVCGARFLTTHSEKRTCSVGCSRKHARTKRGSCCRRATAGHRSIRTSGARSTRLRRRPVSRTSAFTTSARWPRRRPTQKGSARRSCSGTSQRGRQRVTCGTRGCRW